MNILQILPELNYGGVETGTVDLAKYLTAHNHKAVVVSKGGALVEILKASGGIHYALEVHKKSLFSMYRCIAALARIIRDEDIQIVHARSRVPAWIAYAACRITETPFITTCHGYYSRHLFTQVMGWGDCVIVPSQVIGRHMIDDFQVPVERIRLIPRSVDIQQFTFNPPEKKSHTEFIIAIIARITPLKGHRYFIEAIQKVYRTLPTIKVWVVGSAPKNKMHYKEDLELLTKRLGLSQVVEFLGARRDIPEILSKVNLMVMATTVHEAFGRVILEAQASGVPVVATKVGGVVDIIEDGVNGVLVPPGDPEGMAEAILKVLKDNALSAALAQNARVKILSQFPLEKMAEKTLEVYRERCFAKRILILKFSALGDMILSIPALKAIRKKFPPPSVITCLVGKDLAPVLHNCPYIDTLIVYDFKQRDKGILGLLRVGKELRKKAFDMVIDLQNNRKSHSMSALSCAPRRYGYANKKLSFLLNNTVKENELILGPLEHQFRILNMLGIELKDKKIELWPSKEDSHSVALFLESEWVNKAQPLVGIHCGSSKLWVTKRWPLEYISRLSENLALHDIRVVITGNQVDPGELRVLKSLTARSRPIIACGKTTINQLACLIKHCSVFVAADTAPLHIACGMGVPVVALFGPTDPKRHILSQEKVSLFYKGLSCQPCYKSQCNSTECMKQISVEEVEEAVMGLLNTRDLTKV
ncbi:MAG TPA: hypothetical protein DEQ77_03525 [Candidatus Omnitrophica bacterium]|nr:hypothetical protein [Candidatus Omnitrophota bacterium]